MKIIRSIRELRRAVAAARAEAGAPRGSGRDLIAFVPTMGALHAGHLSLLERARGEGDVVVMSIFVNPLQFGPSEDFEAYPRDEERDAAMARAAGVDLLFIPSVDEVYPDGELEVRVVPKKLADRLCGLSRPGHFEGVLTVVTKLFGMVEPDVAVFGRKDFQQSVLVRRLVRDLDMPVRIEVGPVVREEDGLALSSRNGYLAGPQRDQAVTLSRGLFAARDAFEQGITDAERLMSKVRGTMREAIVEPEYIELVDPDTLEPLADARPGAVLAVAARIGETRLIDNIVLGGGADPTAASVLAGRTEETAGEEDGAAATRAAGATPATSRRRP